MYYHRSCYMDHSKKLTCDRAVARATRSMGLQRMDKGCRTRSRIIAQRDLSGRAGLQEEGEIRRDKGKECEPVMRRKGLSIASETRVCRTDMRLPIGGVAPSLVRRGC
jgi:hypothetical protein